MKLKLLFIVMDLLTLLIYPFIFMHGKIYQFFKFTTFAQLPLRTTSENPEIKGVITPSNL